jgi:hypothetical protein
MSASVVRLKAVASLAAAILFSAQIASAQVSTASLAGTVTDPKRGIVPGAEVVVRNAETDVQRRTITNSAGYYVLLGIPPGRYSVAVSKPGFRTSLVRELTLVVDQRAIIDVQLELGALEQSIDVEANGESVQSSTAGLGAVTPGKQIQSLPLNGRNFTQLLVLTPGTAPISVGQNAGGFEAPITSGADYVFPSINGQTNRSNLFLLDGIVNQGTVSSTYAVAPIIDAIEEFKVNSHDDDAEFGQVTGGIVNVVTKSGTNTFHGAAWDYLRNSAFDALDTFTHASQPFRQNEFGGTLGGPVLLPRIYNGKNRTFFFLAYQGFRYSKAANTLFRVPTESNLRGDLSDIPNPIFNPFSTVEDPSNPGRFLRDPFPGNQIPANLLDSGLVAFAEHTLPRPVSTGTAGFNAIDTTPARDHNDEYTVRLDENLSNKDAFWFRYSANSQIQTSSGGRPGITFSLERPFVNYGVNYLHTFSPNLVLQVQYGRSFGDNNSSSYFDTGSDELIRMVGFDDSFVRGFLTVNALVPSMNVDGFFFGGETEVPSPKIVNVRQVAARLSKITGRHTMNMGGGLATNGFEAFNQWVQEGFHAEQTSNPADPSQIGSALASYLLSVPGDAIRVNGHATTRFGGVMSYFFQDSWRKSPRLTINLGLRYDRTFLPPYGKEDTVGQHGGIEAGGDVDLNRGVYILQKPPPACEDRGHSPCIPGGKLPDHVIVDPRGRILTDTLTNWGPRIGLAYRLQQATAIRAGFGIFYENWAGATQTSQDLVGWPDAGAGGFNFNIPQPGRPTPTVTAQSPNVYDFPPPTPFNGPSWAMDPNFKNAYSMQWNFGIQHQFNGNTVMTVNYAGSGTRRLTVGGLNNVALTPGPGDPQERAPFPYMTPTFYDRSVGRANYDAFQFQFERRYSRGLTYHVSYTYSKAIDIGCSGWFGVEGCSVTDPYHLDNNRSVSGFDLTHVLSVSAIYDVPFGKGRHFDPQNPVLNCLLGNWQVNGMFLARSGVPYNVFVAADVANTGNVGFSQYERANLAGDPHVDHPDRDSGSTLVRLRFRPFTRSVISVETG